ncbi:FAD-binding oxidoreductase [Planctomicrobium piriforme]|uniref:Glycolate oxidase n=1 Tax=Planctomicrobium piriforme TaxID=1576369 RepID=A0A1I3DK06_9PLAN|nr:FAD-linked oxidase C-terminal domain-containing protein [Planctomicrobium piriforme]SFH87045.1 glycolate oxidase [Planctomicrobium piriforme]
MTTAALPTQTDLVSRLLAVLGEDAVLASADERLVYECDGYVVEKRMPDVVVFPANTQQVAEVVKLCNEFQVPFVPRGAGTSLAGGTLPVGGGVMICTTRMREILEINLRDRYAVVQPGTVNVHLTQKLKGTGFHFAPDPSSQGACTIGGNVATNSGGPHTLKYGVTVNHVLGLEVVLPSGEIAILGGPCEDSPGYDLTGLFVGSEGTFGICTKIWVRLTRDPVAYRTMLGIFETVSQATEAISGIIGAGIIPAALEMMDQGIVGAVEAAFHFGFPLDAGAVLLIEVDGLEAGLDAEAERIASICMEHGAREVRRANSPQERQLLWKCRKQAFGAIGRLAPSFCTQDGVVPRTKLPEILTFIQETGVRHGLRIVNVFHAGDGNIHPILLFDERDADQVRRVILAGDEILTKCIELGGSVTGEHGIGVEKISFMDKLFTPTDLAVMADVHHVFNPDGRCSPQKMLPTSAGCGAEHIHRSKPGRRAAL